MLGNKETIQPHGQNGRKPQTSAFFSRLLIRQYKHIQANYNELFSC